MNRNALGLAILLAVAAAAYWFSTQRRRPQPLAGAATSAAAPGKKKNLRAKNAPGAAGAGLSPEVFSSRQLLGLKDMARLKDLPLDGDGGLVLQLRQAPSQPRCAAGDIDAIAGELKAAGLQDVLLSVERDDGRGDPVLSKRLTVATLLAGTDVKVPLPVRQVASYGVYLCRDRQRTGRCFGKKLRAINEIPAILKAHTPEALQAVREGSDKVYFFQMIAKTEDGASAFLAPSAGPDPYKPLAKALGLMLANDQAGALAAKQAQQYNEKLTPLPSEVTAKALMIKLGYSGGPSCVPVAAPAERTFRMIDGKLAP